LTTSTGAKWSAAWDASRGITAFTCPPCPRPSYSGTVILDGVLPRKTFSMGEAIEKRFYMEARRIA